MIGIDTQSKYKSSPFTLFLVDKKDHSLQYGRYIAYHVKGAEPFFPDGAIFAKRLVGMPGDRIVIKEGYQSVNGDGEAFVHLHQTLNKVPADFDLDIVLEAGQIWVNGVTKYSYDSRYTGPVSIDQIVGRAYPLW